MSDPTVLAQATTMIERAWAKPIAELETLALQHPAHDPLLRSAMHICSGLLVSSNATEVHQDRLHAMTRPGHTPALGLSNEWLCSVVGGDVACLWAE